MGSQQQQTVRQDVRMGLERQQQAVRMGLERQQQAQRLHCLDASIAPVKTSNQMPGFYGASAAWGLRPVCSMGGGLYLAGPSVGVESPSTVRVLLRDPSSWKIGHAFAR